MKKDWPQYRCDMVGIALTFLTVFVSCPAFSQERVYFTGDYPPSTGGSPETQVFSMKTDGTAVQKHTSSKGTKAHIYICSANDRVYFNNEDALVFLNQQGVEENLLKQEGIQFHSPRCSFDGKYFSVTAWNKAGEKGFIELYDSTFKKKMYQWEGEYASWMKDRQIVTYRVYTGTASGGAIKVYIRDMDDHPEKPELIYTQEIGEYVYDLTEPVIIGPTARDIVFRIYDEHEYYYYFRKPGDSFVKSRDRKPLAHHNVYKEEIAESLEQGQLTVAPDGKYAVMTEHPWNTPPGIYLVDIKTRDSWKIADGFNPQWSADSRKIFFNKDPQFYAGYAESVKKGSPFSSIYPDKLDGYEIYIYDLNSKKEHRLTNDNIYQGFL